MLKLAVLFAFCVVALSSVSAQDSRIDADQVKALETSYLKAVADNDLSFFETHIASEYMGVDNEGDVSDQAKLLAAHKTHPIKLSSSEVVNQTVHISGNTAVVSECLTLDFTKLSVRTAGSFQISRVWQKRGTDWEVLLFQSTPKPQGCK